MLLIYKKILNSSDSRRPLSQPPQFPPRKTLTPKRSNAGGVILESVLSQVAAEAQLRQFVNWHSRKPDRPNIAGEGARAFSGEDSATDNCILGKLASFCTVFVIKLAATGLSYRQPGFVKSFPTSFPTVVRSPVLIYC
jgi:hypothetical protein